MLKAQVQAVAEALREIPRAQLIALIAEQQGALSVYKQTIEELVDERDAARLLNELCHF